MSHTLILYSKYTKQYIEHLEVNIQAYWLVYAPLVFNTNIVHFAHTGY